jgi:TetR/AcrR family transcriptional regulator, tetracycline repressor protein
MEGMARASSSKTSHTLGTSSPRRRAAWGTISREQVVDAAVRVVAAGGYKELTMGGLAADLGVAPMSLYRHVTDKDDLLDEVVDRLLAKAWKPTASRRDWRAWIVQAADKLRRLLVSQPAALHVYLLHPVVSPAAVARMNAMMEMLRDGIGNEESARRAYASIHTYTLGFAALEAARAGWTPESDDVDALAQELAAYTSPRQFADGLRYLLDGLSG